MFERFTERARQVVVFAQQEARSMCHDRINTEHLLLGLLMEEEGIAAKVLTSFGLEVDEIRNAAKDLVGAGMVPVETNPLPFTPRAKKVLELALREALSLGHNYIGTEHLLLGLWRDDDGPAVDLMLARGLTAEKVRNEVIRLLSGSRYKRTFEKTQPVTVEQAREIAEATVREQMEGAVKDLITELALCRHVLEIVVKTLDATSDPVPYSVALSLRSLAHFALTQKAVA